MVKLLLLFQKKNKQTNKQRQMPEKCPKGEGWARLELTQPLYKPHSDVRTLMSK